MIKKLTAYTFILIANIVLLAHAVIPHHHHNNHVCIEHTICVGNDVAHTHNTPVSQHQRGCDTDSTTCVLKQAFVIPSVQSRFLKDCDNCSDTHNHIFYILANSKGLDLQPASEIVLSIREVPFYLSAILTSTPGLRAPPIV